MTPADVIRAAIPGADESTVAHVLWGRTPFPFARLTARVLYRAASRLARASAHGVRLCDHCDRIAESGWTCERCAKMLAEARG